MVFHHESVLDDKSFDLIKSGAKHRKFYLNDEKRSGLKIGDFIKYTRISTSETITVSVKNIEKLNISNLPKEQVDYLNNWFNKADQLKYGLIAIQIERIK
jgi:ASC-1-like (ASCH) protein